MAVKKMVMMNLVAGLDDLDALLKRIILSEQVHIVNAIEEIDDSNFTLSMVEENADEILDMCAIQPLESNVDFRKTQEKLDGLIELMQIKPRVRTRDFDVVYSFDEVVSEIETVYRGLSDLNARREQYLLELEKLKQMRVMELLDRVDIDMGLLYKSKNFTLTLGTVTNENRKKLVQNYENISAAVMHLGSFNNEEAILVVTPIDLKTETDRILRSVHYTPIELKSECMQTPQRCIAEVNKHIQQIEYELKKIEKESQKYKSTYGEDISRCYSRFIMESTVMKLKENIGMTRQFFYCSGWVAEDESEQLVETLSDGINIIVEFKPVSDVADTIRPPTQLKNHPLVAPFETLVDMYGIPSYEELDPTTFLGLSYMLLFGAMFGDLGQGLTLALAGMLMVRKGLGESYGKLLTRLGFSSSLFGFFYDSFFGYESVISGFAERVTGIEGLSEFFFIRPIENINTILTVSIGLGILLLLISLIYSIVNKMRIKDYQEGLFGRNGLSGLLLYISLLLIVASKIGLVALGAFPLIVISIICVGLIIVREPLANLMTGNKPLYHEEVSAYYVESGFDILETFLSMLSNSVSFIRVGAFALNHVGLFIAFHTMAEIIGNVAGNVLMFIIGNVLVICLEGLIVFIQGLRLVYYEMFSKYYTGAGNAFEAVRIASIERA
ncbi:MAG: V-type ATP synthase subunit I [Clostridia bacterium]|nr:V-type ATP synthase subunit I [Clostridia bacterium]